RPFHPATSFVVFTAQTHSPRREGLPPPDHSNGRRAGSRARWKASPDFAQHRGDPCPLKVFSVCQSRCRSSQSRFRVHRNQRRRRRHGRSSYGTSTTDSFHSSPEQRSTTKARRMACPPAISSPSLLTLNAFWVSTATSFTTGTS